MTNPSPSAPTSGVISRLKAQPVLLGALAVALVAAIGGGVAFAAGQAGAPGQTLSRYCSDLTHQEYAAAYGLLSAGARSQTGQTQWVQEQQLHDQIDGPAKSCSAGPTSGGWLTFMRAGASATVQLNRAKSYFGLIVLTHDVDGWKVNQVDPKLQGTDLGPLEVAESFCAALARQDFAAAYGDLSARMHASASQADFTKTYSDSLSGANAKVTGCAPSLPDYSVQPPLASVQLAMQVQVPTSSGASTVPVPFRFALVRESAGWKIDAITAGGQ